LTTLERSEDAVECYDKGISLDPNNFALYYNKGKTNTNFLGCHDLNFMSLSCLGVVLTSLLCFKEAIKNFDKALELSPGNEDVKFDRGKK